MVVVEILSQDEPGLTAQNQEGGHQKTRSTGRNYGNWREGNEPLGGIIDHRHQDMRGCRKLQLLSRCKYVVMKQKKNPVVTGMVTLDWAQSASEGSGPETSL